MVIAGTINRVAFYCRVNHRDRDYEKYLEQKTAQTLGVVDGAGKVTVMITLKSTGQKVVEKDQQSTHQTTKEAGNQGETRESEEKSETRG